MLEICIPTFGERDLSRLVDSIDVQFDLLIDKEPHGAIASVNTMLKNSTHDMVLVVADDFEFPAGSVEMAIGYMQTLFPNRDGIIAFKANTEGPDSTCMMIGNRFLKRFPNKEAFCPEYFHFYGDTELGLYAKKLGRFLCADSCPVIHHHAENYDQTFHHARSRKDYDNKIWQVRQAKGLLWGESFDLATKTGSEDSA